MKYDYPIEHVTVSKTIDVIDLDTQQTEEETANIGSASIAMRPAAVNIDDELVVVDEVRRDLKLQTFFKLTNDSIQQIQFTGLDKLTQENCRSMFQ